LIDGEKATSLEYACVSKGLSFKTAPSSRWIYALPSLATIL
jgi:hypothetical protein